ncbi:MAG TPA: hypothetical protein VFQ27_10945 [Xanthobacteraceae bacterium]|nr:hypothetical protein [Xanthobacteraceae bacterium]
MVFAFDTLGYAKRLRDAGVPAQQAEAQAEAARDFIMAELVTKNDLNAAMARLDDKIAAVRSDLGAAITRIDDRIARTDDKIEAQTLRLTVRLGGLIAVGIAILATIIKLGN